jgi:hypothetical protein
MDARPRAARHRRRDRGGVLLLGLALTVAAAALATWPAIRHVDGHYLARPAAGHGEAAAGDHLQLGWAFWLPGHQLERGAAPWADPYSFRPEAEAATNVQGWLLGLPYWPLDRLVGPVWGYDLVVMLSMVAAGGLCAWWLCSLGLAFHAALVGGLAFELAPYRVGQSTGHLLGLIAFLLPAVVLALERRRFVWAALALAAIPLSGQLHLALGAIALAAGYAWARLGRADRRSAALAIAPAVAAGLLVQRGVVDGSIAGERSFAQVARYSAELADFVRRGTTNGIERYVFVGWVTPLLAVGGLAAIRRQRGLAVVLGLAAIVPALLALGANLPGYEQLWRVFPPLHATRVPERLLPVSALAVAALVAHAVDRLMTLCRTSSSAIALAATLAVVLAVDLHVPVFGAVAPDGDNRAYAAMRGEGRLLELPVFRPDLHFGSAYLGYARQSPRERPQGYSTTAPPEADRLARELRGLSCGRGTIPRELGVRFVAVHRGLYAQSGFFGDGCAVSAERRLRALGWARLATDGTISTWRAPRGRANG